MLKFIHLCTEIFVKSIQELEDGNVLLYVLWRQFHQHFTHAFCANIFHFCAKKLQSQNVIREKLCKAKKIAPKMLMKLTPMVSAFLYILRPYGLIHTRHFDTQYCYKKILRKKYIFAPWISIGQGKLLTNHKSNIFLSQYLFIAILCPV